MPGSGKSTVGEKIAALLKIPFLDKDSFLEYLFEQRGIGDAGWRRQLSLESNSLFRKEAKSKQRVVLVSHWRPKELDGPSGTPTEWLYESYSRVIELYCMCPLEVAAQRFMIRDRHPGHLDENRNYNETVEWMLRYERLLPLSLGKKVRVCTAEKVALYAIVAKIRDVIQGNA